MRKTLTIICLAAAIGGVVSACGSSSSGSSGTKAAGVVLAPSGGATAAQATPATSTTSSSTSSTATVATPKSGPLSVEPKITVPKGPAPHTLQVKNLVSGSGAVAKPGSTVTVNYVGALYSNGKVFDSSWKRNQTFTTPLKAGAGGVISGWVKGISGMKVGGRRELIIPPAEAYGKQGSGSTIPPNSTLIFVVDLLKVS